MVYYLKLNRSEPYVFRNLQHWADIIREDSSAQIFVLCDREGVCTQVGERVDFYGIPVEYIQSNREDPQLQEIVKTVISPYWEKAAYAHLTTFLHARENGYDAFWNVDADDTLFCLPAARVSEILGKAEKTAEDCGIDIFSLDMWYTRTGHHWTFGVTYTRNTFDWIGRIRTLMQTEERHRQPLRLPNVDAFFSRMRHFGTFRIESFYVDKLAFVHYCDDFVFRPWGGGFYEWRDGKYRMPVIGALYGIPEIGEMPLNDDVIRLDVDVTLAERRDFLLSYCDSHDARELTGKLALMRESGQTEADLAEGSL